MNLEQTFLQFLKDWLAWAEADAPELEEFSKVFGLCTAWRRYAENIVGNATFWMTPEYKDKCKVELCKTYVTADDPFGWYSNFSDVPSHKWEPRLKWVRNKIKELEQCA